MRIVAHFQLYLIVINNKFGEESSFYIKYLIPIMKKYLIEKRY